MTPEAWLQIISLIVGSNLMVEIVRQYSQRRSPAQKESEIIKNYGELIAQYRTKMIELSNEIDRIEREKADDQAAHEIELQNNFAVMEKRRIGYEQELSHLKNELQAYQIGWTQMRRIAAKYAPADVTLPEIKGATTQDVK